MMHIYTPNDNYPSIQVIDDSDAPNATNFNTSPEGLADQINYLHNRLGAGGGFDVEFLSSGNFTVPAGVIAVLLYGWGGGGAGGGGVNGGGTQSVYPLGAGGGGASVLGVQIRMVTAGHVYAVTIGAGGTPNGAGADGNNGVDTLFSGDGLTTAFAGAGGGKAGRIDANNYAYALGGAPVAYGALDVANVDTFLEGLTAIPAAAQFTRIPGTGGLGTTNLWGVNSRKGTRAAVQKGQFFGAAGGVHGLNDGTWFGGGGGGGGAAGPNGGGGTGGTGGAGSHTGPGGGTSGGAGGNGSANTGAGGGGGGGGGAVSGGGSSGGNGGAGGSGYLYAYCFRMA